MEPFVELCHQDDHFFCFILAEYFSISEIINFWSLTNKKTRRLIFQSDYLWKRKIQQELPFGAFEKIDQWRRGEYWSLENEELFNRTTAEKLREISSNDDDQREEELAIKRALFTSKSDISALMMCIYFNHAFYDVNYGKCFGVKKVSEFYIFFQFFYRFTRSKETNRVLRYIEDKPEEEVFRKFRNSYFYSILFNSNNPLTAFTDLGFGTVNTPNENEQFKFFRYNYQVELINGRYVTEEIVMYPFVKTIDNTEQVGCYIYPYNPAYPYLRTEYGSDLYFPKDYSTFLNEFESAMVTHHFRNSMIRSFMWRLHFFQMNNNPWYQGRNILDLRYSVRLYFQKRVQKSIDYIYKQLVREKHHSVDLSQHPTREEIKHLFNTNVTEMASLLEDPYRTDGSEVYTKLMNKMWNRYKTMKFHKEKIFIRAIDKCFRRYMNLFILAQPNFSFFHEDKISVEKVLVKTCDITYFGIGLLMIPYITELVEFKILNTIEPSDEYYIKICQVIERMCNQIGFPNIPFISKP